MRFCQIRPLLWFTFDLIRKKVLMYIPVENEKNIKERNIIVTKGRHR